MNEPDIFELLEKYDEGITSLEEEARIKTFMLHHPEHFRASWFIGKHELRVQKSRLTLPDFHSKLSRRTLWYRPLFRIAAAFLVLCIVITVLVLKTSKYETAIISSTDVIKQVTLPDGSVLTLNKNTIVRLAPDFNQSRDVWLDKGEAFFDVVKKPNSPFIIHAQETETRVIGTSFSVRRNDTRTEVSVVSGEVIFNKSGNNLNPLTLTEGMAGEYDIKEEELKAHTDFDANTLAWKTHRLEFRDVSLASVLKTIEQYFQIHIVAEDSSILNCRFRGTFEEANLEEIIEVMDYSLNVKFDLKESVYRVSGSGCNP